MRPFGRIAAIDDPQHLDLMPLKQKSISWHREFMFTRSLLETPDIVEQQRLLARTADLVDRGIIRTTVTTSIFDFSAEGIRQVHRAIESGRTIGKIVVHR